jgi:hypothetical protein
MLDSEECRKYAAECLDFAKNSTNETDRKTFLDMARTWTQAAARIDDGVTVPEIVTEITEGKSAIG